MVFVGYGAAPHVNGFLGSALSTRRDVTGTSCKAQAPVAGLFSCISLAPLARPGKLLYSVSTTTLFTEGIRDDYNGRW